MNMERKEEPVKNPSQPLRQLRLLSQKPLMSFKMEIAIQTHSVKLQSANPLFKMAHHGEFHTSLIFKPDEGKNHGLRCGYEIH